MSVRPIVLLGDPRLRIKGEPVDSFGRFLHGLLDDLAHTMRDAPGVGLAAPQIGVSRRAFVVDVTGHRKARSCHGPFVLFNPVVVLGHGPVVAREGCMSVPDLTGDVSRASLLVVRGTTPDGGDRVLQVDAFEARAVLHELDHLDGLLFLDRVVSADGVFPRRVYR